MYGGEKKQSRRGKSRGSSRQTVTDALRVSRMKSFALMFILMKRISEVLFRFKLRFERDPGESLATGGNQSTSSHLSQTLTPPLQKSEVKRF